MSKAVKELKIEITPKSIIMIAVVIVGLALAWRIREVWFMIFLAFIINSAFRPFVNFLEKKKVPRVLSILIIYFVFFLVVGAMLGSLIAESLRQLQGLIDNLPTIISTVVDQLINTFPWLGNFWDIKNIDAAVESVIREQSANVTASITSVFDFITKAFSLTIEFFTILVIGAYMLQRKENVYDGIIKLAPKETRKNYKKLLERIDIKLGDWLRGQLMVMFLVGTLTWFALQLPVFFFPDYQLDQFALPLAFIAGVLEAIPNLGPILTAIIASVIAAGFSPFIVVLYIVIVFTLIQQVETAFISPTIMHKVVGIDPIVVIIGIIAALNLFGVIGAVLIVPILTIAQIIIEFYFEESNKELKT